MPRAAAARGLPAGATSRAFTIEDFARALDDTPNTVYVYADGSGRLQAAGASGMARAAAAAALAPHPPAASAALQLTAPHPPAGPWRLRLATLRPLAPHDELLLWPEPALLALCAVPFLTPANIRGDTEYRCERCGACFEQPNPLKQHLVLHCAAPSAASFWRALLARLAAVPPPTLPVLSKPHGLLSPRSLFSPRSLSPPAALCSLPALPAPSFTGTAGHICPYCGRRYSRRYGLKIHVRTHTGERPLRCDTCYRRFGDPSNLNKHRRLHLRTQTTDR